MKYKKPVYRFIAKDELTEIIQAGACSWSWACADTFGCSGFWFCTSTW